jgi:hypothetical protein
LENFDAIGRWREKNDFGVAIDSAGNFQRRELLHPRRIETPPGQREADLARNLTERLMAYALGDNWKAMMRS